jgi:hypothetical protein
MGTSQNALPLGHPPYLPLTLPPLIVIDGL